MDSLEGPQAIESDQLQCLLSLKEPVIVKRPEQSKQGQRDMYIPQESMKPGPTGVKSPFDKSPNSIVTMKSSKYSAIAEAKPSSMYKGPEVKQNAKVAS